MFEGLVDLHERLAGLESELVELEAKLAEIYASGDQDAARRAGRRHAELKAIVNTYDERRRAGADLADASELLGDETDADMRSYLEGEVAAKSALVTELDDQLGELLVPRDPHDGRNVIVEIRGAEGGEEANIWAGDLFRMYERFAERHRWRFEVLNGQVSDMGGYRDVTFVARAPDAWARLKYEGGVHRVQRVPATESQGRIHTSAATVAVLAEPDDVEIRVDPNDLQVDVYRSSGPGGQSVNTTDSAVRITHTPTGLVVTCQDEKSQLQNKEKAMRILRARLLAAEQDRQTAELSSTRRGQVGNGGRGDKIRTYNYKESRVTDHRIKLTVHGLPGVLDGDLDGIIEALAAAERADQLVSGDA